MGLAIDFSSDRKQIGKMGASEGFYFITQPICEARVAPDDVELEIDSDKAAKGILEEIFEILL
jgi:hypothetical protein